MPTLAQLVRVERLARGMTQEELATKMGKSSDVIRRIEQDRGGPGPKPATAMLLVRALHRAAPLPPAVAESLLLAFGLSPALARKLDEVDKAPSATPALMLAHQLVDALAATLGEERTLSGLQSLAAFAGLRAEATRGLPPHAARPYVAIDRPDGLREYIPTTPPRPPVHGHARARAARPRSG